MGQSCYPWTDASRLYEILLSTETMHRRVWRYIEELEKEKAHTLQELHGAIVCKNAKTSKLRFLKLVHVRSVVEKLKELRAALEIVQNEQVTFIVASESFDRSIASSGAMEMRYRLLSDKIEDIRLEFEELQMPQPDWRCDHSYPVDRDFTADEKAEFGSIVSKMVDSCMKIRDELV